MQKLSPDLLLLMYSSVHPSPYQNQISNQMFFRLFTSKKEEDAIEMKWWFDESKSNFFSHSRPWIVSLNRVSLLLFELEWIWIKVIWNSRSSVNQSISAHRRYSVCSGLHLRSIADWNQIRENSFWFNWTF